MRILNLSMLGFALASFGFAFNVSAFASPAAAPLPVLQRILGEIRSAAALEPPACPAELGANDRFVFAFEGARGYCPAYITGKFPAPSRGNLPLKPYLERTFTSDPAVRTFFPGWVPDPAVYQAVDQIYAEIKTGVGAEGSVYNCNLAEFLVNTLPMRIERTVYSTRWGRDAEVFEQSVADARGHQLQYYAWPQVDEAVACARSLAQKAHAEKRQIQISVIGYSMGGPAAIDFYERLAGVSEIQFTHLLTLDPVRHGVPGLLSLLGSPASIQVLTESPFLSWRNFFQKSDEESLEILGIRGSKLIGSPQAIRNTWITPYVLSGGAEAKTSPPAYGRKMGHVGLLESPGVVGAYLKLLGFK